jgi:hypothetical protein
MWDDSYEDQEGYRRMDTESILKDELHELIDALPEGETLAAKRFLEFLLNLQEGKEYFSPADLSEIEEGFAQIRRGQYVTWEDFKQRHGL